MNNALPQCNLHLQTQIDAYLAMTEERAYQQACVPTHALVELQRCAGIQFDAQVVEAFIRLAHVLLLA